MSNRSPHNLLSYLPSMNRFVDSNCCIIHDLNQIFDSWQLSSWKMRRENSIMIDKNGKKWRLEYLTPNEEDDVYDFIACKESFGMEVVRGTY